MAHFENDLKRIGLLSILRDKIDTGRLIVEYVGEDYLLKKVLATRVHWYPDTNNISFEYNNGIDKKEIRINLENVYKQVEIQWDNDIASITITS